MAEANPSAPEETLPRPAPSGAPPSRARQGALLAFLAVWLAFQILVPIRHLLYPGSPSWTEEGHRFAWQMKLRDKKAEVEFVVEDPATGRQWTVDPWDYLMPHQARTVATRPDMILQFAHHLARIWAEEDDIQGVEVRARVCASLNGRKATLLIDPEKDLARTGRDLRHADWILPLEEPFERPPGKTRRRDLSC